MIIKGDKLTMGANQSAMEEFKATGTLTAGTSTAVGATFKLLNEFGFDVIVCDCILDVTTKSTGAATLDIGVNSAGTTSDDKILDGVDVGTAAGLFNVIKNKGTNGGGAIWKSGEYIVATPSASTAGMVGKYTITGFVR